jgi:hypothetical protein
VTSFCPALHPEQHAHNLAHARYATPSQSGWWVYLCCGDCGARYCEAVSVWEAELRRREQHAAIVAAAMPHDRYYRSTI